MAADLAVGTLMLLLVGVFAAQRDYMTPFGGLFPDAVMTGLAFFSLLLLARTAYLAWGPRRRPNPTPAAGSVSSESEAEPLSKVILMAVLLAAWLWVFWRLGFVVGGTLGFAALAVWLAPEHRSSWQLWARSLAAGAAWTLVLYLAFGRMLSVPLPFGWWSGRF